MDDDEPMDEDVPPTGESGVVSNLCMAIVKKDVSEAAMYVIQVQSAAMVVRY